MPSEAGDVPFDQRGPLSGACAFDRLLHGRVHLPGIRPVDGNTSHAVAGGALRERLDRGHPGLRCRDRPPVVLDDENHRQLPRPRDVGGLVEGPAVGSPVAEEVHDDLIGLADAVGQAHSRCQDVSAAKRAGLPENAIRRISDVDDPRPQPLRRPLVVAEKVSEELDHAHALGDHVGTPAVVVEQVVVRTLRQHRSHLERFVTATGVVET